MGRDLVMWNIMVLMNIYIPDWQRKSFFMHYFCKYFYMDGGFVAD